MELEAESLTGAPYVKRTEDLVNQRIGFRDRSWKHVRAPPNRGC
jgi:hypothetical protein